MVQVIENWIDENGVSVSGCRTHAADKHEPPPQPGRVDVADYVLADIRERVAAGEKKYGTKLQTGNGRDPLWDLYQELLDAVMYCRQAILERDEKQLPLDTATAQSRIAAAIKARGYRKDYTIAQFVARNVVKLGEELAELAEHFRLPLGLPIEYAGLACRNAFKDRTIWTHCGPSGRPGTKEAIRQEMADCQVVLANMAAAYEETYGESFDLMVEAVLKSELDIQRGVT
jgi:NTP pyrophosphatase (non-canonical NTP hydrolase)